MRVGLRSLEGLVAGVSASAVCQLSYKTAVFPINSLAAELTCKHAAPDPGEPTLLMSIRQNHRELSCFLTKKKFPLIKK